MLRGDLVRQVDPLGEVFHDDDGAEGVQGLLNGVPPGKIGQLPLYFLRDLLRKILRGGDADRSLQAAAVLCLSEEVCGHVARVGRFVRKDDDLARTGDHVDADGPEGRSSSRSARRDVRDRRFCRLWGSSPCRRPAPPRPAPRRRGRSRSGRARGRAASTAGCTDPSLCGGVATQRAADTRDLRGDGPHQERGKRAARWPPESESRPGLWARTACRGKRRRRLRRTRTSPDEIREIDGCCRPPRSGFQENSGRPFGKRPRFRPPGP